MGWLQKIPQTSEPKSFYTIGLSKTVLVVGLGNPEKKYDLTRHNVGFMCIDEFVSKSDEMGDFILKKDFKAQVSQGSINGIRVTAIKPTTYMNLSGEAVTKIASFYHIIPESIVVVHDDLDIDFGQIRTRVGGTSAGHNGIKSITNSIGEGYGRIRIGIGPKQPEQIATDDFVLHKFNKVEQSQLDNLKRETMAIIQEYIFGGSLPNDTRKFIV
jgi:PTH1 family peptidyl-tRNA hydrolase